MRARPCSVDSGTTSFLAIVDIPRRPPDDDPRIKARVSTAGRLGFVFGCIAAIAAITINLWRSPGDRDFLTVATAVLMAALNVPLGIALGLWSEKITRPKRPKGKGRK
jgi:hypothetical protein